MFLSGLLRSALQAELDRFFAKYTGSRLPVRRVTASAVSHARAKLSYEAFVELMHEVARYVYENAPWQRWHGLRLLAIDGSTARLPDRASVRNHFGDQPSGPVTGPPLARVSVLRDVMNNLFVDAIIAPYRLGETDLVGGHLKFLRRGDLVLLDRGYTGVALYRKILARGAEICVRLGLKSSRWTLAFIESGLGEQIVQMEPTDEARAELRRCGLPTGPVTLRLIRVELSTGQVEVLATSLLDGQRWPSELLAALYCKRWSVEEMIKRSKSRMELENFSGLSVLAVLQDFYAHAFTANLTAALALPIHRVIPQVYANRKVTYQINWTQALAKMKDWMVSLFSGKRLRELIRRLQERFVENVSLVRPGRSYPRRQKVARRSYPVAYKPIS